MYNTPNDEVTMSITRDSEVLIFVLVLFVCVCYNLCADDLTMKDWCHTNNILQEYSWRRLVVQGMCRARMTPYLTSPGQKAYQDMKLQ